MQCTPHITKGFEVGKGTLKWGYAEWYSRAPRIPRHIKIELLLKQQGIVERQ